MFHTKITFFDILAVLLVLCLALILLWAPWQIREDGAFLVVTTSEGTVQYPLSVDREFTVSTEDHALLVVIENGEAYVRESNCADGICVASGRISHSGNTVICAPAGVRLLIKGGDADVDHVAG